MRTTPTVSAWLLVFVAINSDSSASGTFGPPVATTEQLVQLRQAMKEPCVSITLPGAIVFAPVRQIESSASRLAAKLPATLTVSAAEQIAAEGCRRLDRPNSVDAHGFDLILADVLVSGNAMIAASLLTENRRTPAERRVGAPRPPLTPAPVASLLVRRSKQVVGPDQRPGDMWWACTSFYIVNAALPLGHQEPEIFGRCDMYRY